QEFEKRVRAAQPKFYITQVTAPTLHNDMYGVFIAKAVGAKTMAFGTHVTPMTRETMEPYPALDFVLRGEPDVTLRELVDAFEGKRPSNPQVEKLLRETNSDLPIPLHHLLPLDKYRVPMMKTPYTFIVTSRGCSAGCTYCIKHVSYQWSLRLRSPENIVAELRVLKNLGIDYIHMYADLFTLSREQVVGLCELMIQDKLNIKWTCNSRVDYVDQEMLALMGKAGCWMIAWGIESGNFDILKHAHKGADPQKAARALTWARAAGIKNWGYFIIG